MGGRAACARVPRATTTLGSKRAALAAPAGTIRTCQKFLIQYNRRQLLLLLQKCTSEGEFLRPRGSARGAAAQLCCVFWQRRGAACGRRC